MGSGSKAQQRLGQGVDQLVITTDHGTAQGRENEWHRLNSLLAVVLNCDGSVVDNPSIVITQQRSQVFEGIFGISPQHTQGVCRSGSNGKLAILQ